MLGKSASASPQVDGSGELPIVEFDVEVVISDGMLPRRKSQVRMPASRSSIAYTPPPFALKDSPKVEGWP